MRKSWLLAGLLFGVWGVGFAAAESPGSALSFEQAEDRAAFIAVLRKARQGDADAQWQVGRTYASLGDDSRALPQLLMAAAAGHAAAASLAGSFREEGRGGEKNREEALRWYRQAAELGEPAAGAALARLLPPGDPAGLAFARSSAMAGNADGQYQLGLHLSGKGPAQNPAEAFDWFVRAAEQGHLGAQLAAAAQLLEGRGVRTDRAAALRWLESAAKTKDPVASYLLFQTRYTGESELASAELTPLRLAANAGHREAQYLLGKLLAGAKSVDERREAAVWLGKAQQAGHVSAANRLGEILRQGVGDHQQLAKARALFLRAAEQGNVDAMYNFAEMLNQGFGGDRDSVAALRWFGRAAEEKHERATEVLEDLLGSTIKASSLGLKGFWQR